MESEGTSPEAPNVAASAPTPLTWLERLRLLRAHRIGGHAAGAVLGALAGVVFSQVLAAVGYG